MIDFANIIGNLLIKYLPATNIDFGKRVEVLDINIIDNKVILTFSESDYNSILGIINNPSNPNKIFTIKNIAIKNQITKFENRLNYGFLVNFEIPHNLYHDDIIVLKGFTNNIYNTSYKASIQDKDVVLKPLNSIPINSLTTGLGYLPSIYNNGLNGSFFITDEGENQLSYTFDKDLYNVISDISKIDKDYLIDFFYLSDNIKVIDFDVFEETNSEINEEFIIVDTASFNGSPLRSTNNNTDKNYNFDASVFGKADRLYSARILYYLVRNIDNENNQTNSGSDIVKKQTEMFLALTSVLLNYSYLDNRVKVDPIFIVRDGVSKKIENGSVVLQYDIEFSVCYDLSRIILPTNGGNSKLIKRVKFNNQEMIINE